MTRYQVDSEAVLGAHAIIRGTMSRIEAEAANLHGQLTNLQSSWTGPAATAFHTVVSDWKSTQLRVEQSLSGIGAALGRVGQQYEDVEQANAQLFRG